MKKLFIALAVSAAAVPAQAATLFNGHYYEYVAGTFTWQQALANAAAAAPMAGYTAHLATITSAAEDNFVANTLTNNIIWLAGTDEGSEGIWRWAAGPETGQIFWNNGAVAGAYTNWNGGEPNNLNDEDYLHTNVNQGNWNDVDANFTVNGQHGYVVEYSPTAIPEPATWAMMIAGFGIAGAALRRRRRIAFA